MNSKNDLTFAFYQIKQTPFSRDSQNFCGIKMTTRQTRFTRLVFSFRQTETRGLNGIRLTRRKQCASVPSYETDDIHRKQYLHVRWSGTH